MLSNSSIYEAQQLVELFAKSNVSVEATPLTPTESLTKASMTAEMAIAMPTAELPLFAGLLREGSQARSQDGGVDHDLAQAEVVEQIAKVVAFNLDTAKNIVNPICLDVLERLNAQLEAQVTKDVSNVAIVPDFYPEIWNSPILHNLIEPFASVPPAIIALKSIVPDQSDADINNLIVTGSTPLDLDIANMVTVVGPAVVASVYREVFARSTYGVRDLNQILNPYTGRRSDILLTFLLARRLVDDIPDGVTINLSDYRLYLSEIQAQAGFALNRVLALRERDTADRIILRSFPVNGIQSSTIPGNEVLITVNGSVYNDWLAAGGRPEVLLGSFITDGETRFDTLLEGAEEYTKAWTRHLALKASLIADERYSRTIVGLRQVMRQVIDQQAEGDGRPLKDSMIAELKEAIAHIHHRDIPQLPHVVRKVVCRTLFKHTSAELILSAMDRIATQYPEMDMNEVALFATIEHVVGWIADNTVNVIC